MVASYIDAEVVSLPRKKITLPINTSPKQNAPETVQIIHNIIK